MLSGSWLVFRLQNYGGGSYKQLPHGPLAAQDYQIGLSFSVNTFSPSTGPGSVSPSNNNGHYQVRLYNLPSKKNIKQVKYIWSEIKKEKARQMAFVDIWLQSTKFLIFFCMYNFFLKVFVDNCFKRKRVWYESLVLKMKLSLLCVNPCVIFPLQYLTPYWIERACTLTKY